MPQDPPAPDEALLARAMTLALSQARAAAAADEVPVGAAIMGPDGALLAQAGNEILRRSDPTAHAERLALSAACARVAAPRLPAGTLLACTLEPCAMCAGALVLARADFLVFGASDPKTGACGSLRDVVRDPRLNHRVQVLEPLRTHECGQLLRDFFAARRKRSDG